MYHNNAMWHEVESLLGEDRFIPPTRLCATEAVRRVDLTYSEADLAPYVDRKVSRELWRAYQSLGIVVCPSPPPGFSGLECLEHLRTYRRVDLPQNVPPETVERVLKAEKFGTSWLHMTHGLFSETERQPLQYQIRQLASAGLAVATLSELLWVTWVLGVTKGKDLLEGVFARTATSVRTGQQLEFGWSGSGFEVSSFWSHARSVRLGVVGVHRR